MVPGRQLSTLTRVLIIPGRQLSTSIGALIIPGRQVGGGIVIHLHLRVRTKRIVRHAMYLGSAVSLCRAIWLTSRVSFLPGDCAETRHALIK